MYSLVIVTVTAFVLSLVLMPLFRDLFRRFGLVDRPDSRRKLHRVPVPRIGGIPIAIAYIGAFACLLLLPSKVSRIVSENLNHVWQIAIPAGIIFITGILDDVRGLAPWQKLAGQVIAGVVAAAAGVRIVSLAGTPLGDATGFGLTVLWLLACTNAFNLIDGLDGLAGGVGLFSTVTILVAALLSGNMPLAIATAPFAGALLGFLRYNFNPASIFLGDCGSLLIGFLLGSYAVIWSQKSATLLGMTAPMIAVSVPMIDTALAIARRFLRRKPIFGADRGHIHHRLLDRGLSPRAAVLVLYGCCALAATASLLQSSLHDAFGAPAVLLFCVAMCVGIQKLGYAEFRIAGRLLARGVFREQVNAHVSLLRMQEALDRAENPHACWTLVRDTCREFGFKDVRLSVAGFEYHDRPSTNGNSVDRRKASGDFSVRIPLSESDDYIQLKRELQHSSPEALISLAQALRTHLEPKIESFRPQEDPAPSGD